MLKKEELSNGLIVYQDDSLYTFTSDSILLSKFANVKKDEIVADFCSGSGIVGFNLYNLNKALIKSVTLFEMQKSLFDLSVKSIENNNLQDVFRAENTKVQEIGKEYYEKFSLITCNPPYCAKNQGDTQENESISIARREIELNLEELIKAISKCLKFGGRTCIVHRADRLGDLICSMRENNIEIKKLQTVSAFNKAPYLVLVEGVKGGKSGLTIYKNLEN